MNNIDNYNKSNEPTVSVILPTHDRAGVILRAINSVLNQTFADFELIIVDDASSDETRMLIDEITDRRVRYIKHHAQKGAGAARNTGIAAARGEYIAFQDSDDEWIQTKLEEQLAVLKSKPEIGVVFSPYMRISPEVKNQIPPKISAQMEGNILATILGRPFIGTPTLLIRHSALKKSGGFDETLQALEDWELSMRLAKHCRFGCIKKPLLNAYITEGSVSDNEEIMLQAMKQIVYLHRNDYRLHPVSVAEVWTFIGNRRCLAGKMKCGRKYYMKAIKSESLNYNAWSGLLLAYAGKNIYSRIVTFKRRFQ